MHILLVQLIARLCFRRLNLKQALADLIQRFSTRIYEVALVDDEPERFLIVLGTRCDSSVLHYHQVPSQLRVSHLLGLG